MIHVALDRMYIPQGQEYLFTSICQTLRTVPGTL